MTVAHVLKKHGWDIEVEWKNPAITDLLEERLGIDLSGVQIVKSISKGAGYDLVFWLSDGSIPILFSKKSILHFQTPFRGVNGQSFLNRLKLKRISSVVCNSCFTKNFIDKEYGVKSVVVYPPVSVEEFTSAKKENVILSVGRFSQLQQSKRQDVLVDVFKEVSCKLKTWKLVLIGGSEVGDDGFVKYLRQEAEGYPIEILENLPFSEVRKFYARAKIFWSAAGYGIDENEEPERVEHFGITVVEAMAAGCIPVVQKKGGHKEIVKEGENGFLWEGKAELLEKTVMLAQKDDMRRKISKKGGEDAKKFSQERFEEEFLKLI
jgi:glycosyltransferase involved in cell wall biosynthesis